MKVLKPALITATVGLVTAGAAGLLPGMQDTLNVVAGGTNVHDALVFLTGQRWGGCFCTFLSGGSHELGNITKGNSQLAVLSESHALHFNPSVEWSAWPDDENEVPVGDALSVPLKVWILAGGATAKNDADVAQQTFSSQRTGIKLEPAVVDAQNLGITTASCEDAAMLKANAIFDENAINVYYTNSCGTSCSENGGWSCADDPRINFVYSTSSKNVLSHELGHALLATKDHWGLSPIGADNIMKDSSAPSRTTITAGQAITMNYEAESVLSRLGLVTHNLDCKLNCPRLELDYMWSNCEPPTREPETSLSPVEALYDCIDCTEGQLSRVVNDTSDSIVPELRRPLEGTDASDPALLGLAEEYRANAVARKQRRAIAALSAMARRNNQQARAAIVGAFQAAVGFRQDVRVELNNAFRSLLPAQAK